MLTQQSKKVDRNLSSILSKLGGFLGRRQVAFPSVLFPIFWLTSSSEHTVVRSADDLIDLLCTTTQECWPLYICIFLFLFLAEVEVN